MFRVDSTIPTYYNVDVDFVAGEALTAGDVAMLDATQTGAARQHVVKQCTAVALGNARACGIIQKTVASGEIVPVRVCGVALNVNAATPVAGNPLVVVATAGRVEVNVAANIGPILGVALEDAAGNVLPSMLVADPLGLASLAR